MDWLESIGAPLPKIAATGGTVHMYLHEPEDGSAVGNYLVDKFQTVLEDLEIPVYTDTEATELIEEDGKVVGVKAEGETADYIINAKAVVLATGGFGANEEMYCSYRPDLKGTVTTNAPGATGDGIVMAQAVGADLVDIDQIQLHPTVFQENGFLVSERLRSNGAILVNKNGQRFTNDLATRDAVSAAELEQPDCFAYIVYDSQYAEESLYQKYVTNGLTVQGDTIEDLAKELGFDDEATQNFVETVEKWNDTVNNGTPDEFERNNGLVALEEGPYFAIKIAPGIHHTMGGLKIDTKTEVIDTEGQAIPGLFAAGEVTGGVHGGNRIGGNAVADIVVYGRIAGQSALDYMNEQ
ncbi:MAG: flavocytochrome c [Lachnospiraceae bacterium]|nr:flavocytochrome c [Candidatus Equihabitans merdae]